MPRQKHTPRLKKKKSLSLTCWTLENKEVSGLNQRILRVGYHITSEDRDSCIRDSAHVSLLMASKLLFWLNTYIILENY